MTRSPFLDSGRRRRGLAQRRRRRRARLRIGFGVTVLVVAGVLALLVGSLSGGTSRRSSSPAAVPAALAGIPSGPTTPALSAPVFKLIGLRDRVHLRFRSAPRSGLLFNLDTGEVLWRMAPLQSLPIASLTKMMTALLVVDHSPAYAHVRITRAAAAYQGSGVGVLPRGGYVPVETLLNGLLLPSGNDAAIALAQHVAGTLPRFVADMNQRATALGLRCTHYASVDGFNDAGRSCAEDLAVLAHQDLDQPRLARIVRRRRAVLALHIRGGKVYLYNNNPLIVSGYPGITGLKTGYTSAAGSCLVATATRHGVRLGVVLLHSPDTATQARQLLDQGFRIAAR